MELKNFEERAKAALIQSAREEWLTVKEFAALVHMHPGSVREAIRMGRLNPRFRVERLTTGRRPRIRIVVPKEAA